MRSFFVLCLVCLVFVFFLLNFRGKLQGQKVDERDRELSGIRMHDVEYKKNQ